MASYNSNNSLDSMEGLSDFSNVKKSPERPIYDPMDTIGVIRGQKVRIVGMAIDIANLPESQKEVCRIADAINPGDGLDMLMQEYAVIEPLDQPGNRIFPSEKTSGELRQLEGYLKCWRSAGVRY